jgi:alkylation response protein AidB-like acyl-CoA dehydrogenase
MGWLSILVPESAGGMGLGLREASALCVVLGQGLVPEPVIPSMFALQLLGDNVPEAALTGEKVLISAWQDAAGTLDPAAGVALSGGRLSGAKSAVEGAAGADAFVVTLGDGVALVDKDAAGLKLSLNKMQDGCAAGRLEIDGVCAHVLPCPQMSRALHEMQVLHAAYLLGVCERAFEMTLEYLRIRKQFGVAIGSFQALQHRATEIKVQIELARAAINAAARVADTGGALELSALKARARSGLAARLIAREAIQLHGAIGITDEADIGLFVRKIMVQAGYFGTEPQLRARYMAVRESTSVHEAA